MAERKIKSFDEVMKSIKNKNYKELKGVSEQLDGVEKLRVDAIIEMIKFEEGFKITNKSKKVEKNAEDGKLIRIPKTMFLNLIRKNPHYGLFLSKLLAQRVIRQNRRTLQLSAEIAQLKSQK